jgi:hypothetical protein
MFMLRLPVLLCLYPRGKQAAPGSRKFPHNRRNPTLSGKCKNARGFHNSGTSRAPSYWRAFSRHGSAAYSNQRESQPFAEARGKRENTRDSYTRLFLFHLENKYGADI